MLFDMHFKLAQAWMEFAQVGVKAASDACLAVAEQNARSWERSAASGRGTKTASAETAPQWPFWPMLAPFAAQPEPQRLSWSAAQPWAAFWSMTPLGQMLNAMPGVTAAKPATPTVAVTLSWPLGWPLWQMPALDASGRSIDPFASFRSAGGHASATIAAPLGAQSTAGMPWWTWMTPVGRA